MNRQYNQRSPAVRRLMREAIELREPTSLYHAQPMEDNLFEWHFTIQGPPGTDYEGGRYHGRILLPPEYPMKPPSIVILTPNGRFELNQKICLSASAYHPEMWQASWGIRTMLLALVGFMPTNGRGTIGSLECTPEVRKHLAKKSLDWTCSTCGVINRTALPNDDKESSSTDNNVTQEMKEIVSQMAIKSQEEVDAQFKDQLQRQGGESQNQRSHDVTSHDQKSQEESNNIPQLTEQSQDNTDTSNTIRQRVPNVSPPTVPPTSYNETSPTFNNQGTRRVRETRSNPLIIILIVIIIIFITALVMRKFIS